MVYIVLLMNILILVSGQMLWKVAVSETTTWNIRNAISVFLSPNFILGAIFYVIATVLWLYVLSKLPLNIAYPMQSISYVIGSILAVFIFKETISSHQIIGMVLIVAGVIFISK